MKKLMLAAAVSFGLLAAASAQVQFDQGVDLPAFVGQAVNPDVHVPMAAPGRTYTTRDCVRFSFGPAEGDQLSERVWLRSQEYVTECHTVMQPGPNGQPVPVQNCYDHPGMSWTGTAQVKVLARKLWPWETDVFEACMNGPWIDLYVNQAGYKYSAKRVGSYDTLFELAPQYKVAMKSDENGINYGDFSFQDGKFVFKAADKWAKEYAGEKVVINVDLYSEGWWVFNGYKGSKEFTFDAADLYTMAFTEADLTKPETPDNVNRGDDRGAKKYFLKWSFKRVGAISKDNVVKKDKTPSITK